MAGGDERAIGLAFLRELADGCTRCPLAQGRTSVVFGEGPPNAPLMIVGMAPGEDEDRAGRPFIGAAGRALDAAMERAGVGRSGAYVANVVMCHPPENRLLTAVEVEACAPYLALQLSIVQPQVVLALGGSAAQRLTGRRESLETLRRDEAAVGAAALVVSYHPSPLSLNREPARRKALDDDLAKVRRLLAAGVPAGA